MPASFTSDDNRIRPARILLGEHWEPYIEIFRVVLESLDCQLDVASDVQEILKRIEADPYDLILIDINLHPTDGPAAARGIRELETRLGRAPTRLVGVMAGDDLEKIAACKVAGMDECASHFMTPEYIRTRLLCR
jgi:CheY-like chemotaxis protein